MTWAEDYIPTFLKLGKAIGRKTGLYAPPLSDEALVHNFLVCTQRGGRSDRKEMRSTAHEIRKRLTKDKAAHSLLTPIGMAMENCLPRKFCYNDIRRVVRELSWTISPEKRPENESGDSTYFRVTLEEIAQLATAQLVKATQLSAAPATEAREIPALGITIEGTTPNVQAVFAAQAAMLDDTKSRYMHEKTGEAAQKKVDERLIGVTNNVAELFAYDTQTKEPLDCLLFYRHKFNHITRKPDIEIIGGLLTALTEVQLNGVEEAKQLNAPQHVRVFVTDAILGQPCSAPAGNTRLGPELSSCFETVFQGSVKIHVKEAPSSSAPAITNHPSRELRTLTG